MKTSRFGLVLYTLLLNLLLTVQLNASSDSIRLNQTGFYTYGPKVAVIVSPPTWYFSIRSVDLKTIFYQGELSVQEFWRGSRENLKRADFSDFTRNGTYVLYVAGTGASWPFVIGDNALHTVSRGLLRAFYFQRASTALSPTCAGAWSRNAGHPDDDVRIHPSAASDPASDKPRKTDETFASPKGWYDAGDYGKYVVNAGISTYELLLLYEQFPDYFTSLDLNIPESGNALPDILDEIKWELDWLLTMQDPADSGVYHKLTTKYFTGEISPEKATLQRYFIGKGTAATFNFTAVCAVAYRIYKSFLPTFADSCLTAAEGAWKWGMNHPDSSFRNPSGVVTGQYGDNSLKDERQWASFELFIATGDTNYYNAADTINPSAIVPDWQKTGMLGRFSMALHRADSISTLKIISEADKLLKTISTNPYRVTISTEYYWGSNGVTANQGTVLLVAYLLTGNVDYLEGAIHACDYLLGRNATGYCFVTGFGHHSPMDPHHRPSLSDNRKNPVPGFLVGGPNAQSRAGENCLAEYPSPRAKAYMDHHCSFTTNEVAINWNAAGAFLANGINAIFSSSDFDLSSFKIRYQHSDTTPPGTPEIVNKQVGCDDIIIGWKGDEPVTATLTCKSIDGEFPPFYGHSDRDTSGMLMVKGLRPSTEYDITCTWIDDGGNRVTVHDSIRTEPSAITGEGMYTISPGTFSTGEKWQLSTTNVNAQSVRLIWAKGGRPGSDTIAFQKSGSSFTVTVPESDITTSGLLYRIEYINNSDTLSTREYGITPESFTVMKKDFARKRLYQMVSIPGVYSPVSSISLNKSLGDTSQWRYFGYDTKEEEYVAFDMLPCGGGGLLYHKENRELTYTIRGIAPDSLFPIPLESGWNCISSPFIFDIFWDNTRIDVDGAVMRISDSVANRFLRRQFFTYSDTTQNNVNDGVFLSNRKIASHAYADSARLSPWNAYWVYAEKAGITCLLNPSPSRPVPPVAKKRSPTPRSWFCSLHLRCGDNTDGPIVFGSAEGACASYDQYDTPKPPAVSQLLKAGFVHNDWPTGATLFAADITPYDKRQDDCWIATVTAPADHPVTLTWNFKGNLPGYCYLIDSLTGVTLAMNDTGSYRFFTDEGSASRSVSFVHTMHRKAVGQSLNKWAFSCSGNNPIRFSYTIPHSVQASFVSLDIINLSGQKVRTLLNRRQQSGVYTRYWDMTDDAHLPLANGLYIARITTPSFTKNIRLNIVNR